MTAFLAGGGESDAGSAGRHRAWDPASPGDARCASHFRWLRRRRRQFLQASTFGAFVKSCREDGDSVMALAE